MKRLALVLASTLASAGCSTGPNSTLGYTATYAPPMAAAPGRPLAMLPAGAGPVIGVNENRKPNAIVQDIVLGGDQVNGGANKISVTALVPPDPRRGNETEGDVKLEKPTAEMIEGELPDQFPGIPMQISTNGGNNAQGPFAYAIGHGPAGSTCIYAWQWIGPQRPISLLEGATGQYQQPISVRVRLCKPRAREAQLVALVQGLVVTSPNGTSAGAVVPVAMTAPGTDLLSAATRAPMTYAAATPAMAAPVAPVYVAPAPAPMPVYAVPAAAAPGYATSGSVYATMTPTLAPSFNFTASAAAPAYAPGVATAVPAYADAAAQPTLNTDPAMSDDNSGGEVSARRRGGTRKHMVRRASHHSRAVQRPVVREEQPEPAATPGSVIPMPSDMAASSVPAPMASAAPARAFPLPGVTTPATRSVPAPAPTDSVPLPH